METNSIVKCFTMEKFLKIDFHNFFHEKLQKEYHGHFSVTYTTKLSWNTYFMHCTEWNISHYPRFNINVNCFLKLSYKNKWKKARIHCEIFLSDYFMKHSLMNISIVYKKTDEWYIELQRVTTNDNEWQQVVQRMTTADNKWPFRLIFRFFN